VALISISKSHEGLTAIAGSQLSARAAEVAKTINKVYEEEKKVVVSLSLDKELIEAERASSAQTAKTEATPAPAAPTKTGKFSSSTKAQPVDAAPSAAVLAERAMARLKLIKSTKGLGESYQVITLNNIDGVNIASSDPAYVGSNISDRSYFQAAIKDSVVVGAAVLNKITGKPCTPVVAPVKYGDKVVGVVNAVADIAFLGEIVAGEKLGRTGYGYVVDNTGLVIAHPTAEYLFTLDMKTLKGMELITKRVLAGESGLQSYIFEGIPKTAGFAHVSSTGWSVVLTQDDSEFLEAASSMQNLILLVSGIAILAGILIYFFFAGTITKPLKKGVAFAQLVASGDFTQQIPIRQKDEVGILADSLNAMSVKLKAIVATIQDHAVQVATSSEQITSSAQKLAEGAQSQASTLEETSASVEELTASVDQVAEHAQSQAAAVEEGSSSMEQVHHSIESVSKNLLEIANLAGKSVENALEGAKAVTEVMEGINLIAGSSEKIGGIVSVISDIADQMNLLALNASIEAARAGEHGRGFAVVADEVSKLADRSSLSTKEIEGLIKESVRNVTRGVETAKGSQRAMEQIRVASQKVKEMIAGLSESMQQQVGAVQELSNALASISEMSQSISAATEEQTTNAKQVSKAVENVNEVTQSAASAAEEMSSATQQLAVLAQDLQRMTSQFKIGTAVGEAAGLPGKPETQQLLSGPSA
jgi:methyl-accepting chemotaxis protein